MRTPLLFLCLFFCSVACDSGERPRTATDPGTTTVYLVRHAEKGEGSDPDLLPEGAERAERLAGLLDGEELSAIYTTDTRRTRQTAAPVAERQGLSPTLYDAGELEQIAQGIRTDRRGTAVLVVGHSNTTPALARLLSASDAVPEITEEDFGTLIVVTIPQTGPAEVATRNY